MVQACVSAIVGRAPSEVFAYIANRENERAWNPAAQRVKKVTAGPIGPGTRFRAAYKFFGTLELTVATYEPVQQVVFTSGNRLLDFRHTFQLEPAGAGTRLTQIGEERAKGIGNLLLPVLVVVSPRLFRANAARLVQQLQSRRADG